MGGDYDGLSNSYMTDVTAAAGPSGEYITFYNEVDLCFNNVGMPASWYRTAHYT